MADKKFWIGFAVVFVVVMLAGFVVHGLWLEQDYLALPNIMRAPADAETHMAYMLIAHVSIAAAATWIYRQGRKDGDWVGQGLRFGLAVALVSSVPLFLIYHAVAQFPLDLTIKQCIGDTASMMLAGLAVAFVHR